MNVVLLSAAILAMALLHGGHGEVSDGSGSEDRSEPRIRPCEQRSHQGEYTNFVRRHILKQRFHRQSKTEWKRYLEANGLCGRASLQFFIDASYDQVNQICRGHGRQVVGVPANQANVCISDQKMNVYNVQSTSYPCTVTRVWRRQRNVVVACNKIHNQCLPVRFEQFRNQRPGIRRCI